MDALSASNGTFALTLLKKLGADSSKNVFISPLSISSALAMVLMGAKGNTAAQMCQVRSGSRLWAAADALSLVGEPVSAIRIQRPCSTARPTPLCPPPWAPLQCLSAVWPGAPDSAAPDSSRTGLNEQAFIEPLLRPAAQGPAGRGPSCRDAQSQPQAGCTGCGRQLLGHSGGGVLTSGPWGSQPSRMWGALTLPEVLGSRGPPGLTES